MERCSLGRKGDNYGLERYSSGKEGEKTMDFGIASVAGITMICYLAGMGMKASEKVKNEVIPVVCGCAGAALGVAGMFVMPDFPAQDVINAAAVGIASGLAATGINQAVKQLGRR